MTLSRASATVQGIQFMAIAIKFMLRGEDVASSATPTNSGSKTTPVLHHHRNLACPTLTQRQVITVDPGRITKRYTAFLRGNLFRPQRDKLGFGNERFQRDDDLGFFGTPGQSA